MTACSGLCGDVVGGLAHSELQYVQSSVRQHGEQQQAEVPCIALGMSPSKSQTIMPVPAAKRK